MLRHERRLRQTSMCLARLHSEVNLLYDNSPQSGISDLVHADAGTLSSVLHLAQDETRYKPWSVCVRSAVIFSVRVGLHGLLWSWMLEYRNGSRYIR